MSKLEEIVGKSPRSAPPPTSVAPTRAPEEDDDDFDLFGSEEEEESEEQADQRAAALAKYNEKKSKSKCTVYTNPHPTHRRQLDIISGGSQRCT